MSQSLRFMPVSTFGAVMGVAGLALCTRSAAGVLDVPGWIAEAFALLAVAMLVALLIAYGYKCLCYRTDVAGEWQHAGLLAFFGTVPIALALAGGCIHPYAPSLAAAMWTVSCVLWALIAIPALGRWLRGGVDLVQVNTGWMIMLIGPVPMAVGGLAVGAPDSARVMLSIGLAFTPLVMVLAFVRTIIGPALQPGVRALSFILLVPPGLAYVLIPPLWNIPNNYALESLFYLDVVLAAGLFVASRDAARWPFTPAWWAMTFPLDALAAAAVTYAKVNAGQVPLALAWVTWLIALAVVLLVLLRSCVALLRGSFFVAPKPA